MNVINDFFEQRAEKHAQLKELNESMMYKDFDSIYSPMIEYEYKQLKNIISSKSRDELIKMYEDLRDNKRLITVHAHFETDELTLNTLCDIVFSNVWFNYSSKLCLFIFSNRAVVIK